MVELEGGVSYANADVSRGLWEEFLVGGDLGIQD